MHGDPGPPGARQRGAPGFPVDGRDRVGGVAGLRAKGVAALEGKHVRVDGISEREKRDVRLQPEPEAGGPRARELRGGDHRPRLTVERDRLSPLEPGDLGGKRGPRRREPRLLKDELTQPRAEVAQRERARGIPRQVGLGQAHEGALAKGRDEARAVVPDGVVKPKPVHPAVELQPLERRQPVVRLYELRGDLVHGPAVDPPRLELVVGGERPDEGGCHHPLERPQVLRGRDAGGGVLGGALHTAAFFAPSMNSFAFRASSWTSSNEGILSSHSSRVAVTPHRRVACA